MPSSGCVDSVRLGVPFARTSVLVTTSKAIVTRSDALVPTVNFKLLKPQGQKDVSIAWGPCWRQCIAFTFKAFSMFQCRQTEAPGHALRPWTRLLATFKNLFSAFGSFAQFKNNSNTSEIVLFFETLKFV